MKAMLLCVGSLKETYWKQACQEYAKRLTRYMSLEIAEVSDEADASHQNDTMRAMQKEGERILAKIKPTDHVVALAIDGKTYDSPAYAKRVEQWEETGKRIVFLIGGSSGLAPEVMERANEKLSFSKMTFPHQMMRVIFLEQLYRAWRIIKNQPYHK